jgi:hypothetical protein
LGDRVRWWRFRQAVKLCLRARQLLDEADLEPHEIRPGVLVPLFEGATLADDDERLQERWAALLANAAATPSAVPPSFPYILGQIGPTDAALLDRIFDRLNVPGRNWQEEAVDARIAGRDLVEGRDFELALDNLFRLRLVYSQATYGHLVAETVMLTTLGAELVRACKPPASRCPPPPRAIMRRKPPPGYATT